MAFPRLAPAVITLVTRDDGRALLGRNANFPIPMFSCLAGFVEPGETLEQAVAREVARGGRRRRRPDPLPRHRSRGRSRTRS